MHPSPTPARTDRTGPGRRWFALIGLVLVLVGLSACGSDSDSDAKADSKAGVTTSTPAPSGTSATSDDGSGAGPIANAITITTPGMAYDVSGDLQPGVASITLKNTDTMSHMMAVARLKDGVTLDQVKTATQGSDESAMTKLLADPESTAYGTPAPVGPGQESTVIAPDLEAGHYAVICFFSSDDGTPHFVQGMVNEFTVTGAPATEKPEVDGTITVDDKAFTLPDGFTGQGTFEVTNSGTKPHNLQIVGLDDGATLESYFGAVGAAMGQNKSVDSAKGGTMVGGVDVVAPGQTVWLVLDLPKGHYGYLSTEDAQGEAPPSQIGEFTVS